MTKLFGHLSSRRLKTNVPQKCRILQELSNHFHSTDKRVRAPCCARHVSSLLGLAKGERPKLMYKATESLETSEEDVKK